MSELTAAVPQALKSLRYSDKLHWKRNGMSATSKHFFAHSHAYLLKRVCGNI